MKKLSFCLMFLLGCNRNLEQQKIVSIDSSLQPYVNDFVDEGRSEGVTIVIDNLSVRFADDIPGVAIGQCSMFDHGTVGTPSIIIERAYWDSHSEIAKKVVIFHELGHCVLFREHVWGWTASNIVASIMYYSIQYDSMYSNNWAYYMHELFHGG